MRILYNAEPYGYSETARQRWIDKGYQYQEGSWSEIDQTTTFPNVEVLIVRLQRRVNKAVLDKFPDLKAVVSATTGHDHLDENELSSRKIELLSLRGHEEFLKTIPSTAEHTWAVLLALIRNLLAADNDVRAGHWNRDQFRGHQLKDKTLGIIGYGRTGQQVATYADAFQMRVIFYDPFIDEGKRGHRKLDSLENLLDQSDVVSIHVHLTPETKGLLSGEKLKKLKKGAYLLNTSRGKLWDELAVVQGLEIQQIAGVATDVLSTELDNLNESPLWQAHKDGENVIITPHIGGATWDAMWACEEYVTNITF